MTTTPLQFLERILPAEGFKCATVIHDGRAFNRFFSSFADLWAFISSEDAHGRAAYHACASFSSPDSRKASNALGARALWMDMDAGPGKPYETAALAALAVRDFTLRHSLPKPVYVGSGFGLHIYWPLGATLSVVEWRRYALGLKRLCDADGLQADPVRTADISSVLRTPGTHNRKHGEYRVVRVGDLEGPYDIADFAVLLKGEENEPNALMHSMRPTRSKSVQMSVPSLVAAAGNIYADEPRFTEPVTRACRQVAELAVRNGNVSEPLWYAALGVLAACSDGPAFAHHWSSGYPGYSHAETQARLDRSKEFGPTTCAKFESLNAKGCEGCPFKGKITSPIQLGRKASNGAQPQIQHESAPQANPRTQSKDPTRPEIKGFTWSENKLICTAETNNGMPLQELVSEYPIYLESVQEGEAGGGFSLSMKLELPREGTRSIVLPAKTFFSASGMSEIAGQGAIIHNTELFKK